MENSKLELSLEKLKNLQKTGMAEMIDTAQEGTCQLWIVYNDSRTEYTEYVVLCDNTIITRKEDQENEPVFPL